MALRILAATACVAGQGLKATSIDDIAAAAGCARATIYRLFPGGRAGLLAAAAELQITSVLEAVGVAADAETDLASSVTAAVHAASTTLAGHAALQRLLAEEPGQCCRSSPSTAWARCWPRPPCGARALPPLPPRRRGRDRGGVGGTRRARPPPLARLAHRHHRPHRRAPRGRAVPSARPRTARHPPIRHRVPRLTPGAHVDQRRHHRSPARQRPRRDPRRHQHRRRRGRRTRCGANADAIFTWDYERSRGRCASSTRRRRRRSGTPDRPRLVHRRSTRRRSCARTRPRTAAASSGHRPPGTPFEKWGDKEWIEFGVELQNWTLLAVHARRAGRADLHRADRRDRAVDRRQVLRGHAGDGRGPPRRGVRPLPRREAVGALPDQRAPRAAARRHHRRQPLGHDLPRHADHGRGPRARRVRLHAPDDAPSRCSSSCCAT